MRNPVLLTLGELALGIVIGFIAYNISGQQDAVSGTLSIAVGLLTSLLAATLTQHFQEQANQRRLMDRLDLLVDRISDRALTAADAASALKYGAVDIARSDVTRVWLDRLWRTSSRYWGVVYTAPGEVLDTSVFQLGLAVLAAKVRVDQVDVRRVFLVDDQQELDHVLPAMRMQETQINIRYLMRSTLDGHSLLKTQLAQLPTEDFALMDRHVVWLLLLDNDRRIKSGALHFDEAMNNRFSEVFRLMWDAATPLTAQQLPR